ncbi:domain of unknown function DUF1731 [Denitrovibrio acetiphilus DSM 12809]|uniref:TIGR01777 family protein n=2 Tax=Denitrovibrio TaxID=117999 RepID=D4H6H5_DENA2|nr:domain of unknown function DUF1731 [Denitrovibrio acetiphilus DSM 12809]
MSYIMGKSVFYCNTEINSDIYTAFSWHEREGALQRLTPPWEPLEVIEKNIGINIGASVKLKVKAGFISTPWHAEHVEYNKDQFFKDIQTKGPFSKWEHSHYFKTLNGKTLIIDEIEYQLPMHNISKYFAGSVIKKKLRRMFAYRQAVSKNDIETLSSYKPAPKTIVVSGATGVVGSNLIPYLQTQGHKTIRMLRNEKQLCIGDVCWNPYAETMNESFEHADVIIHLAGEPIGNANWTNKKKLSIVDSRVRSTSLLAKTISNMEKPPKLLICASAIGYYGDRGDEILTEESGTGKGFISHVCYHWEKAAKAAEEKGIRVVYLRIGVALSPQGGALERTYKPTAFGLGTVIGSGRQYLSWVSMDDVLYAITHIIENDNIKGAVNLTAPNPVRWKDYADTLAHVMDRPRFLRVPEWLIKTVYGQMGREVLLASANVQPKKLLESGFTFRYPILEDALRHQLGRTK